MCLLLYKLNSQWLILIKHFNNFSQKHMLIYVSFWDLMNIVLCFKIAATNHIPISLLLCCPLMAWIFLSVLLALYTQPILHFVLPEIKLLSLDAEYLYPEDAKIDVKILVKLLLHIHTPVYTQPSFSMSFICFIFGLWSLIEVYQVTWCMVSPENFIYWNCSVVQRSIVLTIGIDFF